MDHRGIVLSPPQREALMAELAGGIAAVDSYAEEHGSFAEGIRDHYERLGMSDSNPNSLPPSR